MLIIRSNLTHVCNCWVCSNSSKILIQLFSKPHLQPFGKYNKLCRHTHTISFDMLKWHSRYEFPRISKSRRHLLYHVRKNCFLDFKSCNLFLCTFFNDLLNRLTKFVCHYKKWHCFGTDEIIIGSWILSTLRRKKKVLGLLYVIPQVNIDECVNNDKSNMIQWWLLEILVPD